MKILHVVGGNLESGAFKGAYTLHKALKNLGVDSKILNDEIISDKTLINYDDENIININRSIEKKILSKIFVILEKLMKFIVLPSKRSTFTFGLIGHDISKLKEVKNADIIHIHWLKDGFISLKTISKINKPVVWTMRDMWPFTGGSHYTMEFEKYEKNRLSKKIQKIKKKFFKKIYFVAMSEWLKTKAENSYVLNNIKIEKIFNNVDLNDFNEIPKEKAKSILKINTKKKIILLGSHNPQSLRKGWDIFLETLKILNKDKYFLLIFGKFWSSNQIKQLDIEFKSLGYIQNINKLNAAYSCSDLFLATSLQEAFGKTWVEALACNKPVICFKNTAIAENIKHKLNGFIVENRNSEELKDAIDWIIDNLNSNNNLRETVQIFDKKKIAMEYLNLYKKILNN